MVKSSVVVLFALLCVQRCEAQTVQKSCTAWNACSTGFQLKATAPALQCDGAIQPACSDAVCCDATCQASPATCGVGFQLKVNPNLIVCGASIATCTTAVCCDTQALCSAYGGCTTGFVHKATAGTIVCGTSPALCTTTLCCDATCGGYVCNAAAGFTRNAASATCGALPTACSDALCCDTQCSTYTCSAGYTAKAAVATCGATAGFCTDSICCDAQCPTFNCAAFTGYEQRASAAGTTCGSAPGSCTTALCCDVTCANTGFNCANFAGFVSKTNLNVACGAALNDCSTATCCDATCSNTGFVCAAPVYTAKARAVQNTIRCGNTAAQCTDAACCDVTCADSSMVCGAGFVKKANPNTITCGATGATCTTPVCCDVLCSNTGFACSTGFTKKSSATTLTCGATPATCSDTLCCDVNCAHPSFVCGTGYISQGAAAASITCGTTLATCTDTLCCGATCANNQFACSAGLQKKASPDSLSCLGRVASCTDTLCCDVYCDNAGFQCGNFVGFTNRAGQAAIMCGAGLADCNTATCCDALCSTSGFACSAGNIKKAAAASLTCGSTAAACSDTLCCDVLCSNTAFACSTGYTVKTSAALLTCGSTTASCSDALCCDASCGLPSFTCQSGLTKKAVPQAIMCTNGQAGLCDSNTCCDATCQNAQFSCNIGFSLKANPQAINCGGPVGTCTDGTCCDVTCSHAAVVCAAGAGLVARASSANFVCGASHLLCSDADCCDATCTHSGWAGCSAAGYQLVPNAATLVCGQTAAQCNALTCCQATCTSRTCGAGFVAKANQASLICGSTAASCSDALCCDATCANTGFTCPTGYTAKAAQASLTCGATAALCSAATCCDFTCSNSRFLCSAGYQAKNNQNQITCGASLANCDDATCCDATCTNPLFTCPLGYQAKAGSNLILCGSTPAACGVNLCCDATLCGTDQRVLQSACVACAAGSTNTAGDSAAGGDTQCDATLCGTNFYVRNHFCVACASGETNMANDDATGQDTFCDVTQCPLDHRVQSSQCVPCQAGTTNAAGDRANGGDTSCTAVQCLRNQRVANNICVPCPAGSTNQPNDDASGSDTTCDATTCLANQRVLNNACIACPSGTTNLAGDDATGTNTVCTNTLCGANQRVLNNACVSCPLGSVNAAGDDASAQNTQCDSVLCSTNQHVVNHACSACPPGTTNQANDDATLSDTLCDATLCPEDQYVLNNACTACPAGSTNFPSDDASGPNTRCDNTLCEVDQKVLNNQCVPCEAGATNARGDDATAQNTFCDTIFCAENENVQANRCMPCPNSYRNQAGDPANGPNTLCEKAAGILVAPTGLLVSESGDSETFTVVLESQPFADVTINVRSGNTGEARVDVSQLVFTPSNWGGPRTVTVTGVQDAIDDGAVSFSIILDRAVSGDSAYNLIDPADVTVTNMDDDSIGVTVSPTTGLTTTEAGGTATFSVALHTQPTAEVTIALSSTDPTEGTLSINELVFHPGSLPNGMGRWSTPQTVVVTGQDDAMQDGDTRYLIVTGATTSADPLYAGINPDDVAVTNTDDDVAGVRLDPVTPLVTTEAGGTAMLTLQLLSEPMAAVTAQLGTSDVTEATVLPATVQFTAANWNTPVTLTVTGVDDSIDDGDIPYEVTVSTQSTEAAYSGVVWTPSNLLNADDDKAGVTLVAAPDLVTSENGSIAASFTVVLDSEPTAPVSFQVVSSDTSEGDPNPSSVTFTAANWNSPAVVTIVGKQDDIDDGDISFLAKMGTTTSTDPKYSGVPIPDVMIRCLDDDEARIDVVPLVSGMANTTEGGIGVLFNIRLATEPTADVTVAVQSSDHTEGATDVTEVVFRKDTWREVFTVTLTGQDDRVQDGDIAYEFVTSQARTDDAVYRDIDPINVPLFNIDDDIAAVTVFPTNNLVTTEMGGTAYFNVSIATQPTSEVWIRFFSDDTSEGTLDPAEVRFTPGSWEGVRQVAVVGMQDAVDDGDTTFLIRSSGTITSDLVYARLSVAEVSVVNLEDDVSGVTVAVVGGGTDLFTSESGNTSTFTVTLNTQPTADVTLTMSISDDTEASMTPTTITFSNGATQANTVGKNHWGTPQTVTVTGLDDVEKDGSRPYNVNFDALVSSDVRYGGMKLQSLTGQNADNDMAEVIVVGPASNIISETGLSATFTMQLSSQPMDTVTCPVVSRDVTEGKLGASQVIFTRADWDVPHTVTLTGIDDTLFDGDITFDVELQPCASRDTAFNGYDPADLTFINRDLDSGGAYLITVFSLQLGGDTDTLCTRAIADFSVKYNVPAANIGSCKVQPSTPQAGVTYDVVTLEVFENGATAGACDRLLTVSNGVNNARNSGTTLAGRAVADTETQTVHCPRVLCTTFNAGLCASNRVYTNKTCANDLCDALTCCEPAEISFVVFKSDTCNDVEYSISTKISGQVCQTVSRPDVDATEYGALYCDLASNLAYARTGFSSLTQCGDAIGSLARLEADPATVIFPCDCTGAQNVPISDRPCSPVNRGGAPLHGVCGAGALAAAGAATDDDDDDFALWKLLVLIGLGVLCLLLCLGVVYMLLKKKGNNTSDKNDDATNPLLEKDASTIESERQAGDKYDSPYFYSPAEVGAPPGGVADANPLPVTYEEPPYVPSGSGRGRSFARPESALVTPSRTDGGGVQSFAPPPSYVANPLTDTHYMTQPIVH